MNSGGRSGEQGQEKDGIAGNQSIEMSVLSASKPPKTDKQRPAKNTEGNPFAMDKTKIKEFLNSKLTSIYKRNRNGAGGSQKLAPYNVEFPSILKAKNQNYISTTKYTIITFIPLNLFFQFRRYYNLYFLLGALSVFSGFSSLGYVSQVMPLLVVLTCNAIKEAIEDINRYKADTAANNTPAIMLQDGARKSIPSKSLKPGDVVYITKGSKFYVDVILLSSSYDDGTAFIDTAELDGETNLKRKSTVATTVSASTDESISKFKGVIECEHPNENLLSFEGRVTIDGGAPTPLSMLNLVPRGSILRNTDFAYGVVVYAGQNTKIMKNLKQGKLKSSSLEAKLNTLVLWAFVYNAFLLASSVIFEYLYYTRVKSGENFYNPNELIGVDWYIGFQSPNVSYHVWGTVVAYFAIYTYVIPISLFVTVEMARLGQAIYMVWDNKMTYRRQNADKSVSLIPMRVNNSNLNEDLGCIDYIFSDKTGTLTQNSMNMSNFWCDGIIMDEMKEPGVVFRHIKDSSVAEKSRKQMHMFMLALSICHGVIPAWDETRKEMLYESQSPDETALLVAARTNKYSLSKRTKQNMEIEVEGRAVVVTILGVVEFNSTRKRMSVIVRLPPSEGAHIRVFCKGADNIMMARLSTSESVNKAEKIKSANSSLTDFSNIGLRTLVIGYRDLSQAEFDEFKTKWDAAEVNLEGNREELLDKASDMIETNLTLVGCTAIEDKLQDKVPETIENLLQAGIKMWLLTGDKQETAINIGLSSRLIDRTMKVVILASKAVDECERDMDKIIEEQKQAPESQIFALVVDGSVLSNVFAGADVSKEKFLRIGKRCKTVICSRVTPLQKALVVRLVRRSLKDSITLAIGDGANDVSMIQEAHVGVGIMGKEGTQAVRAADYAFGEFRFLQRLLTYHGRFSYVRMANLTFFSFYKNLAFITIQWFFGFVNAWSGQIVYEELYFTCYNVFFTSLPPLLYAIYEKDMPEKMIEDFPQLYRDVKARMYWNWKLITRWFIISMATAILIFGSVYFLNFEGTLDDQGRSTGYWVQCYLFSTPLLIVVLLKQSSISKFWFWLIAFGIVFSFSFHVILMYALVILEKFFYTDYKTSAIVHDVPAYYFMIALIPAVCTLPDLFADYIVKLIWPYDNDIALEYAYLNKMKV